MCVAIVVVVVNVSVVARQLTPTPTVLRVGAHEFSREFVSSTSLHPRVRVRDVCRQGKRTEAMNEYTIRHTPRHTHIYIHTDIDRRTHVDRHPHTNKQSSNQTNRQRQTHLQTKRRIQWISKDGKKAASIPQVHDNYRTRKCSTYASGSSTARDNGSMPAPELFQTFPIRETESAKDDLHPFLRV
uniref:Secreted protein n=1 Tax=Haemonchus contortus TaxID=6289 RepID=A0A7I4YNK9_HAECO